MLNNKNFLRIMSVLIAFGIWYMVISGQEDTRELTVPVKISNVPNGYIAVSDYSSVSIIAKGSAKVIQSLENSDILLNLDVSSFPKGRSVKKLLFKDFKTPLGIEVTDIKPGEITVTVDELVTKDVRATVSFIGEEKTGFMVESVSIKPNVIKISGGKSILDGIETIAVNPINISDRSESFSLTASIGDNPGIKSIVPKNVEVRVKLREDIVSKEFKDIPVSCMDLRDNLKLKNSPALKNVKVRGRKDIIENFEDLVVFVTDCSGINKVGKYTVAVAYRTGVDIEILELNPQKINIEIVNNEKIFRN